MKKRFTLIAASAVMLAAALSSASGGVAEKQNVNRTGSPGSDADCAMCHKGGSFASSMTMKLMEGATEVTEYTPGSTYQLKITINHTGASAFGFQATSTMGAGNTAKAGEFKNAPTGVKISSISGNPLEFVEHSSKSNTNEWTIDWTAPATGSGEVKFYGNGIAANGTGNTSGDLLAAGTALVIAEASSSSVVSLNTNKLTVYPNPATNVINLAGIEAGSEISIYNLSGQLVKQEVLNSVKEQVDISAMPMGTYVLSVNSGDEVQVKSFVVLK